MKRAFTFSFVILSIDQILKWFFQMNFHDKKLLLIDKLGFTFVTNPGLYVSLNISDLTIIILQIFVISVWVILFYAIKYYQKLFGKSILIDLSFAFLTTGLFGNLIIDRLLFGHIRDYFILPMGVANLADFCGLIALVILSIQIYRSAEFRSFLFRGVEPVKVIAKD